MEITKLTDTELEDLITDLFGKAELTDEEVKILTEADEEYGRRNSDCI